MLSAKIEICSQASFRAQMSLALKSFRHSKDLCAQVTCHRQGVKSLKYRGFQVHMTATSADVERSSPPLRNSFSDRRQAFTGENPEIMIVLKFEVWKRSDGASSAFLNRGPWPPGSPRTLLGGPGEFLKNFPDVKIKVAAFLGAPMNSSRFSAVTRLRKKPQFQKTAVCG